MAGSFEQSRAPDPHLTPTPYIPRLYPDSVDWEYSGVVPVGPLPGPWQGVQKANAVANVGTLWARFAYLPLTAQLTTAPGAQKTNPMGRYRGPGIANGPTEQAAAMVSTGAGGQSLGRRVMSRLKVGGGG